jgi:hypothetical protein
VSPADAAFGALPPVQASTSPWVRILNKEHWAFLWAWTPRHRAARRAAAIEAHRQAQVRWAAIEAAFLASGALLSTQVDRWVNQHPEVWDH